MTEQENTIHTIALAGNPNVGKSTVFNALTGLHQHTGNWPGKTVSNACGIFHTDSGDIRLVDIPGTYSLLAHSAEEEVARDFICSGDTDAVVVVCDATCLERNLNLALQIMETGLPVTVCVNLLDEAKRKHIHINLPRLQQQLGVPVIGVVAQKKSTLRPLHQLMTNPSFPPSVPKPIPYAPPVESAIESLIPYLSRTVPANRCRRLAIRLLDPEPSHPERWAGALFPNDETVQEAVATEQRRLAQRGYDADTLRDHIATATVNTAHTVCQGVVTTARTQTDSRDRAIDRILTGRRFGYPTMLLLLTVIFWLTMVGANVPSQALSYLFNQMEQWLHAGFSACHSPAWLEGALVDGAYRVLAWVVSVMLPPMAIFFPLFTLLEDVGYLPRIAYNLDRPFQCCHACGKQALTMCMGFGCNAAGVVGCRIIDSPRERMLAILTNSFVPCNGRFPTLIALITVFFVGCGGDPLSSVWAAVGLTGILVVSIAVTFLVTRLLSATILKGTPSSFTLELPPYRRPQVGRIIVRSLFDRAVFVLGRAAAVAAPAGLVLWICANVSVNGISLLQQLAVLLNPIGNFIGLDGTVLVAFLFGLPANEIVIPILSMMYLSQTGLQNIGDVSHLQSLLTANGWTTVTAVCMIVFSLFHWPCSTTLLTVRKETGKWRWVILSALLPTAVGFCLCALIAFAARFIG